MPLVSFHEHAYGRTRFPAISGGKTTARQPRLPTPIDYPFVFFLPRWMAIPQLLFSSLLVQTFFRALAIPLPLKRLH